MAQDMALRSRVLADGFIPEEIGHLSEEELESLLDYEDGSTMEACAERLAETTVWGPDTPTAEIVAHIMSEQDGAESGRE